MPFAQRTAVLYSENLRNDHECVNMLTLRSPAFYVLLKNERAISEHNLFEWMEHLR